MTINVVTNSFSQNIANGKCSNIFSICSFKAGEKCMIEKSSRLRQTCGAKKAAAEGALITVPVHSVYFAFYHRKYLAHLTGLRTFTAQARWLKT